ncbi:MULTISPECIES: type VI secretion system protein TssR domain-containing protein [Bacteroides]|uniref:type VI secretion system protein TssR domain-containing protein n=1 Tax=Bacteroides TaxID=816 RepID=UPI0008D9145C|nr:MULTISPECIES: type VI secretion system protein TssR domain-containing protein [Bacteroides]
MKQKYYKSIAILFLVWAGCSMPVHVSGQVSAWNRTRTTGKNIFNYLPDAGKNPAVKKDRSNLIVYSDRNGNQAYEDAYFQRKRGKQEIGVPYYIIDEENGNYSLVRADQDIIGKPKVFYSFLLSKKRHFKDPSKVEYAGWIPADNILMFDHAYIDKENNQPVKFRVGLTMPNRLLDMGRYFRGDTLCVFGEPLLKNKMEGGLLSGQIVYAYKYDKSKRSVLVSDCPTLDDDSRKVFGWVPSDLIAEVGQNRSFLLSNAHYTDSIPALTQTHDTLQIQEASLQSRILFDYAGNVRQSGLSESGHTDINIPVLVWNSRWNNLINIKGGNIHSSDIRRMEKENNLVNIHFLYFEHEQQRANMLCNTLQNMKMKLSPDVQYRFTATCISNTGNRYSQVLSDFSKWIDFITTDSIQFSTSRENSGLNSALSRIMNTINGNVFDKNLFIILGSNQNLKINESLIARAGQKSASFLFVQTNRSYDTPYQDFVLQAKSTLDELSRQYVNHIANYIVDDKLIKPELFRNLETDEANIFLFDVPSKSLSAGGIIFPKGRGILHNTALELALDSINMNIQTTNATLLESLQYHESKLGTLRSRPTDDLKEIVRKVYKNDTIRMERISRNSVTDTYFTKLSIPDSSLWKYKEGYVFSEKELENLLQNYRGLLPEFADSIQKKEFRILRRIYPKFRSILV